MAYALLGCLVVVMALAATGPVSGLWRYEVIENGSMEPALNVGGVAVLTPEPVRAVQVGQVLAFEPPGANFVRVHRVIAVSRQGGDTLVVTKGDANDAADPGPVSLVGGTVDVERYFVPDAGYLAIWLRNARARLAFEAGVLGLMVLGGLYITWARKERVGPSAPSGRLPAQKAAAASMASLNQLYSQEPRGASADRGAEEVARANKNVS